MTREYSLVIKGDPTSYSAYVPELPTILVTGRSLEELAARAAEAIRIYWETVRIGRSPTSTLREIEVELPARHGQYGTSPTSTLFVKLAK